MPNNAAWDTATTDPANRATQAVSLSVAARSAGEAPVGNLNFLDNFETGDISAQIGGNYVWDGAPTTDSPRTYVALAEANPETGGNYAFHYTYQAGSNWVEKRFTLPEQPDLWTKFWIRVPDNYEHDNVETSNNRKFFAAWTDGYSTKGDGATALWEMWSDGNNGSRLAYHFSEGNFQGANGHKGHFQFITVPEDLGRWMQVVMRTKLATSKTSNDGIMQFWRKWEGESVFTKHHEQLNCNMPPPDVGPQGFVRGYLLGYFNQAFSEETTFLIDDVAFSSDGSAWV